MQKSFVGKRGATEIKTLGAVLGMMVAIVVIFVLLSLFVNSNSSDSVSESAKDKATIAELLSKDSLSFLTYIVGGVPNKLVELTNPKSAVIIVIVLFVMLLVSLGDVLSVFGMFSTPIAWVLGVGLAIMAANLNLVVYIAVISFGIVSGIGILSIAFGILVPFILFFFVNWGLLRVGNKIRMNREAGEIDKGANQVEHAITGLKKAAKAYRK